MIKRIIPFAHSIISDYVRKDDHVIDATCGNGNDTLFLSNIAKHVYSFDIQDKALENAKKLLDEHNVPNVTLLHDSHDQFTNYDFTNIKAIMYNLGYLPGENKDITTTYQTTISSMKQGLMLLQPKGVMVITVYTGHAEGAKESDFILDFVSSLSSKEYNVLRYEFVNKKQSPYNIIIEKLR